MRTAQEMQAAVVDKATEDEHFRSHGCSAIPRGRSSRSSDVSIPQAMEIQVHEESSTSAHLVLPPASKLKDRRSAGRRRRTRAEPGRHSRIE